MGSDPIERAAADQSRGSGPGSRQDALRGLIASLPGELYRRSLTHASWTKHRADAYGRLAFLGDSVLGLAIAEHLFSVQPRSDIGRLTKVHGQAVSGRACARVALELGLPELMAEAEPDRLDGGIELSVLLSSERALASVCESAIGACYLHHGLGKTKPAVVAAFAAQVELAAGTVLDHKSALQERIARSGERVRYAVTREDGPPHDRTFEVAVSAGDERLGSGVGGTKKAAEQAAAQQALERLS